MPIVGSSYSTANKDMMSKIWTNRDTVNVSGRVENIVKKEEFLLFPQCFQKLSVVDVSKWVSME